jgi:hypothetical protein
LSYDSDTLEPSAKRKPGFFARLFCDHDWSRYGSGYDSLVRCDVCEKVREEKPGDIAPW